MAVAVRIEDVSKRFKLYQEKLTSLKERVLHLGRVPYEEFWALRDINLEIEQGETVGLLGHNGSGKSTLLKCIGGILQPTTGEISMVGRLAALLELGAGFHPELTGRENVFLNASILGMPKREIAKRFDEIVAFAELERFIDNQVKHYSSGMYVRLGFAVAVNMDPDILLVDEVLAVGDEAFQRKCLDRVRQFQRDGRTIIFVTHAADLVRQICDRALVLDNGQMVALGTPGEAVRIFREHLLLNHRHDEASMVSAEEPATEELIPPDPDVVAPAAEPTSREHKRTLKLRITKVTIDFPSREDRPYLVPGDRLDINVEYEADEAMDDVVFGCGAFDLDGRLLFGSNTEILGIDLGVLPPRGEVCVSYGEVPLLDGTYYITIGIESRDRATVYDWHEQRYQFEVMNPTRAVGMVNVPMNVVVRSRPAAAEGAA